MINELMLGFLYYGFIAFLVMLAIFLALALTYCIGRMLGAGFSKSFEDRINQSIRSRTTTTKGETNETK